MFSKAMSKMSDQVSPLPKQLGVDLMSDNEEIEIAQEILKELNFAKGVPNWHRELLEERIAEAEANPGVGSTWEEVKARLLKGS